MVLVFGLLLSQGSLSIFWSNPLVGSIAGLAMLMLVWPALGSLKSTLRRREMRGDGRMSG